MDTSPKTPGGTAGSRNTGKDQIPKFSGVMRCSPGNIFIELSPHEFRGVEFGSSRRELIDMQAWVLGDKISDLGAAVNGMSVPQQDDRASAGIQQVLEETHDFLARDRFTIGLQVQFDLAFRRSHAEAADQIQALVVMEASGAGRGLAAQRPGALEWRNLRKAGFVE